MSIFIHTYILGEVTKTVTYLMFDNYTFTVRFVTQYIRFRCKSCKASLNIKKLNHNAACSKDNYRITPTVIQSWSTT